MLGQHGSVITCYSGTQTCTNGVWGECQGGTTSERLLPGSGSLERLDTDGNLIDVETEPEAPVFHTPSLTDAGPRTCPDAGFNNPCDPSCMGFPEVPPDGGIAITGVGNPGWKTGTLNALPGSITSIGIKNPATPRPIASSTSTAATPRRTRPAITTSARPVLRWRRGATRA